MRFEDSNNLSQEIKRSLSELGYNRPTDIQFKAIPSILKGEDVMAVAQTGTGKTAAFAIPILDKLHRGQVAGHPPGVKCVVLAPTHELALQISEEFEQIGKYTQVRTFPIIGGVDQDPQIEALTQGVDIIVATPGRLFDLLSQGHIRLDRLQILVLDEADHMLDLGFVKDIDDLSRSLPRKRQTLFFSATLDDRIKKVAYSLVTKPIRIQVSPKDPVAKNIDHAVAFIEMEDKRFFLERLLKENAEGKFIAFVRTIVRAERVAAAMDRMGIQAQTLHRDKPEAERGAILRHFKEGEFPLLVTTDISARGIDIPHIDVVVNYDLPEAVEMYVHRVGRTGRGKEKGMAISFCSEQERPVLEKIEAFLKKPIRVLPIGKGEYAQILELAVEQQDDWRSLIRDAEEGMASSKKKVSKSKKPKKKRRK